MIKVFTTFFVIALFTTTHAQISQISGKVIAQGDVENIHVINKTSNRYATTNKAGSFEIGVRYQDTLVFTSIRYKIKAVYVDSTMIENRYLEIVLEEFTNELDEVTVGRVLTKDLESDVENSQAQPKINFFDVGIPGYKGKQPTQKERLLIEADHGKFLYFYGIGFAININKVLNRVSGRTKQLKRLVKLEKRDELMYELKAHYSESLFENETLSQEQKMEFFFFCSEDVDFETNCRTDNKLKILEFLQHKLLKYKKNLSD